MKKRGERGEFGKKYELEEYKSLFEEYGEWVLDEDKSTTRQRLKDDVKALLYWCEQNSVDPLNIKENDTRSYIKHLKTNYAETTTTRRFASLSKFIHWMLVDPDITPKIDVNPATEINLPEEYDINNNAEYVRTLHRDGRNDIIALSKQKIERLLDENVVPGKQPATRTRNLLINSLLWQTALRADELSRVRKDKIDWEKREIEVRSSKLDQEKHPELYHRRVWWEPDLDLLMRRWYDLHRSQLSPHADDSSYLFLTEQSEQMRPSHISRIVKETAHNTDIQEPLTRDEDGDVSRWLVTAHRLRHSRITYLANKVDEMDLNFIRMMSGHANMETTLDYVQADWKEARDAYHTSLQSM